MNFYSSSSFKKELFSHLLNLYIYRRPTLEAASNNCSNFLVFQTQFSRKRAVKFSLEIILKNIF